MDTYNKINEARKILELPEEATFAEIKKNYRNLIRKWHPDRCKKDQEICKEMTAKIVAAYRTITAFCDRYRFSFSKDEVDNYQTDQEWWASRFGNDPLWGKVAEDK